MKIKYLLFIISNDIIEFNNDKRKEGYTIINECTQSMYDHFMEVDEKNKTVTMTHRKEAEYETYNKQM